MEKIALPKQVKFEKTDKTNCGVVIVEPCYPGYGVTLGNSLRRVLISSLPGAAVIGVKIKGVSHEFMAVPHVKQDILEVLLNLKDLRMRVHTDEVVVLNIDVHGEKVVKASDIEKNSLVEIANPDLEIATITDMSGSFSAEIYVQAGKGYETIESRERSVKHEANYIEVDSAFSPILNVGINVESVRVGKMTNWDKLILTVTTDGTISVEDAFTQSTKILLDQFNALSALSTSKNSNSDIEEGEVATADEAEETKKTKSSKKEE